MSNKGTSIFVMQRLTAVLLLPLVLWFLWSVVAHAGDSFSAAKAWAGQPKNAILLGAFITIGAIHMRIGLMEVIEDYIHGGINRVLNALNWLVALAVVAVTWWSLYSITF